MIFNADNDNYRESDEQSMNVVENQWKLQKHCKNNGKAKKTKKNK